MIGESARKLCALSYGLNITFKPHPFDFPDEKGRVKKKRRTHLTTGNQPLRGTLPVRQHFRIDESKVSATERLGITDNGSN